MICLVPALTASFSLGPTHNLSRQMTVLQAASTDSTSTKTEPAISCFITNAFEVDQEGATPHVVCTSEPDAYAWLEGIDPAAMKATDGSIDQGALECVEGASPRGIPEWECRPAGESNMMM